MESTATEIAELFALQRSNAARISNTTAKERIKRLRQLLDYVKEHISEARAATWDDFRKPAFETDLTEIFMLTSEISFAIKNLSRWMKPEKVPTPLSALGTQGFIQYQAKGNALIISPWNYPINLAIKPLVSAIAAGCVVIIKPSELTPNSSAFVKKLISDLFPPSEVAVIEGGVDTTQQLLKLPFNHIFFTGSPTVGKIVMKAAADHLCSVTLELGGKSPAIIDETVNIPSTARKIAWAKFLNNGQTCVAPDYLLVHESVKEEFIRELEVALEQMYGKTAEDKESSTSYGRIVNRQHFDRLQAALKDAVQNGGKIRIGGDVDPETLYIAPTVLTDINEQTALSKEEIFGPLLPVYGYNTLEEVSDYINRHEPPLALYIHTKIQDTAAYFLSHTRSGNALVNELMSQYGHHEIPFGGINNSGIGKSNGFFGFREFSNPKGIIKRRFGTLRFLYPPYSDKSLRIIKLMTRYL